MDLQFITPSENISCPKLWKDFSIAGMVSAKLEITGLGLYRAFLNGARIGADYLTPGFNDYDAYLRYQTYDVTELLQADNRLEVWLGNGWYKGRFGTDGGAENRWGEKYLLAARLELVDSQGQEHVLQTDESWLASRSAIQSGNIYDGEIRDDRVAGEAVRCEVVATNYHLEPEFSAPIRVQAEFKPVLITTPKGESVLDFGQNLAGAIRFVNRLPKGATLHIQTGEVLQGGNFYRANLRSAKSEFIYTSDGVVKQVEPMFTFYGFRYAKVEGLVSVNPDDFTALALCSDLKETLTCKTDHAKLNQLMQNTLWGQKSNFLDVPTDCPQRDERLGWTADTQVFVNTACYQMDCKPFYHKFMRDLRADQTLYYNGDLPMYSPSLKGEAEHGGAVWADAGTIIPWNVYMNYGDRELLRENYPMMRDYVETLIATDVRLGNTHIVFDSFTFGDWLAQDGMTPQSLKGGTDDAFIQGVYYMNSVELIAKAAAVLGETADAQRYALLRDEIHAALLDEYISPNGNLTVDTQTGYVLALYYGIHRGSEKLVKGFIRRLERDFFRITCGFTGAPLMLPVLFDNGMTDIAYRMLLNEEFPGWLYSVNLGATTIWERWNSLNADGSISGTGMNSLNHYAYGAVCEAIYSRMAGLRCAAPGWTRVRIAPKLSGRIRHMELKFNSPAGSYAVEWQIEDSGEVLLSVEIPEGAQAEIELCDHPEQKTCTVGAGRHVFAWQPIVDYLHPYGIQSRVMDLLQSDAVAAMLREKTPALYGLVANPGSEFRVMPLIAVSYSMPFLNPAEVMALEPQLRAITI